MVGIVEGEGIEPTLRPSLTCKLPHLLALPPIRLIKTSEPHGGLVKSYCAKLVWPLPKMRFLGYIDVKN